MRTLLASDLDIILAKEYYQVKKLDDLHFKTNVSEEIKRAFKNIPIEYIANHFKDVGNYWAIPTNVWFYRSYKKDVSNKLFKDIEKINRNIMIMTILRQTPEVIRNWILMYAGFPPIQIDDPMKPLKIFPDIELPCGLFTISYRKSSILLYLKLNRLMNKMYTGKITEYAIRKIQELANKYHMRPLSKDNGKDKLSDKELSDLVKMLKDSGKFDEMTEEELIEMLNRFSPEQLRNLEDD